VATHIRCRPPYDRVTRRDRTAGWIRPSPKLPIPILLVDDNAAKRLALRAVLPAAWLCDRRSRRPGLEALRRLISQDFAVILLDVQMPIMNGFETAAAIRERQAAPR
jgi:CheY-like chemotaxis protein